MMRTRSLVLLTACFAFIASGCVHKKAETAEVNNCITEQMEKSVTLDSVAYSPVEDELKLTGKVTFDEDKIIKVYPVVSGVVTDVRVGIGDHVQKGQILAGIRSSEMAGVENDMTIAKSDYEIALKNFSSVEEMYNGGIASGKDYTTAKEELQKAQSGLDKATSISGMYSESNKTFYVKAPISGVIVNRNINPAMQIRADYSDNLFTISDLKDVWVMANIFESDIAKVKKGYDVEVTTLSYPDKVIKGKVDKLYDVLDDVTKVMKARIRLNNNDNQLKPGMFANVTLHFKEELEKPEISSRAVIFDNSKNYVVVYRGKCELEVREITIYKTLNDKTYLESGLKIGERVIVSDNLLIYDQLVD